MRSHARNDHKECFESLHQQQLVKMPRLALELKSKAADLINEFPKMIFCIGITKIWRRGEMWVHIRSAIFFLFWQLCWSPPFLFQHGTARLSVFVCLSVRSLPAQTTQPTVLKFSEINVTDSATVPALKFRKIGRPKRSTSANLSQIF